MLYGLYHSSHGAAAQVQQLEVISNNLANAETVSFKRDLAVMMAQPQNQDPLLPTPENLRGHAGVAAVVDVVTNFANGPVTQTGADLDVSIRGPGFMHVSDGEQEFLTRDGILDLDPDGTLVQKATRLPVLSVTRERIAVPPGFSGVDISREGGVFGLGPNGLRAPLGQIALVQPESLGQLQKQGDGLYGFEGELAAANPDVEVWQGYIEESSVQPIREMLSLIETSRAVEANMNMIQYQESSLGELLQTARR